jgi:hypothetical protein
MLWMAHRILSPAETASPKPKYRVTNWPAYNRALVSRGEVTLWIDDAVLSGWRASGGKGKRYSDAAILCALSLRAVFKMPLRQTQGFLASLKKLLELTIPVPHYSTLARRAAGLVVPQHIRASGGGPVHLAVDTMTGEILAHELTPGEHHDGPELPGLLAAVGGPIQAVCADGAYDSFSNHAAILAREARPVIPPRKGAAISPPRGMKDPPPTRGEAVRRIAEVGRKEWKKESGLNRPLFAGDLQPD